MVCNVAYPNWQVSLHGPMAWLEATGAVADLLDLRLVRVTTSTTLKHKMHPKLPLRAVTPELPQSSHLELFWRQKRWVAGKIDLKSCLTRALTLHCMYNWCGFGNIIFWIRQRSSNFWYRKILWCFNWNSDQLPKQVNMPMTTSSVALGGSSFPHAQIRWQEKAFHCPKHLV